jgi:hypothetical protein
MSVLSVETIPKREWKNKDKVYRKNVNENRSYKKKLIKSRYDKGRKSSQFDVDTRLHYLWYHYLQLCLNLEELNYYVMKKGSGGIKVISKKKIRVSKTKYKKWGMNEIGGMKFQEWYNEDGYRNLFLEEGWKHTGRPQYHSLVTKYNVFINYYNLMNGDDFVDTKKGNETKEVQVCGKIFEVLQKERFDELKKEDGRMYVGEEMKDGKLERKYQYRSQGITLVKKNVKECENILLSVCQGYFPKQSV